MARAIVFDVNETLLDVGALREPFGRAFGDERALGEWFARMLHLSLVLTLLDAYRDFGEIGTSALGTVAARRGVQLSEEARDGIVAGMRSLPPHPEVARSLARLREASFPLATLTNSSAATARAQLESAGLLDLFDHVLSVEEVGRHKPAPEPYRMAADRLGLPPGELRLVAAHDWDVAGARRAGCATAFVARQPFSPLLERAEIEGEDLAEVADRILERDAPS